MYFVVFWDKVSGIVHKSWINLDLKTFKWPRTKNPTLHLLKGDVPKEGWLTYTYSRVFGPYGKYINDEFKNMQMCCNYLIIFSKTRMTKPGLSKLILSTSRLMMKKDLVQSD